MIKRIFSICLVAGLLPVLAVGQTAGGSVTVVSNPGGAEVMLKGDASVVGVTPTTFQHIFIGKYDLILKKSGFETYKERVLVDPSQNMRFDVNLSPKTALKAGLRSTFLPGWGQRYSDQPTKGWLFHFLAAGSVAAYFIADHNFDIKYNKFVEREEAYDAAVYAGAGRDELEGLLADLRAAQDDAYNYEDYRRITIGTVVGVWGLSVLDALLFFPDNRSDVSVGGVTLDTGSGSTPMGLTLSYRF